MKNKIIAALICTATLTACKPGQIIDPVTHQIIDCTKENQSDIINLIVTFATDVLSGGGFDWDVIQAQAIAAGSHIGGCAIAAFTNRYLAPAPGIKAPSYDAMVEARGTLESVRLKFGSNIVWMNGEGQAQ